VSFSLNRTCAPGRLRVNPPAGGLQYSLLCIAIPFAPFLAFGANLIQVRKSKTIFLRDVVKNTRRFLSFLKKVCEGKRHKHRQKQLSTVVEKISYALWYHKRVDLL
jgi:hypothetical protein